MARRKRGRPIDGWLIIDKPQGVGSTDVVSKARWAFDARKAGHAGALDPLATGVLAIAFGEATKTVPFAMDTLKAYRFAVRWGEARDSDDADGAVVAESAARPDRAAIDALLPEFRGEIQQRPPSVSAIKVDGARAYDLARDGAPPALAPRPIWIESLALVAQPDADRAVFEMTCGKGGYVRAVARDLGARLGCWGHVEALRRLWSGAFHEKDAISFENLDDFRDREDAFASLLPVAAGLDDIPAFETTQEAAARLRLGQAIPVAGSLARLGLSYGDHAWASLDGAPVAIGVVQAGVFHPRRVLNLGADRMETSEN